MAPFRLFRRRFVKEGTANAVVTDTLTGLVWAGSGSAEGLSWAEAVQHSKALKLQGREWRLPTILELATLYDGSYSVKAECWREVGRPYDIHVSPLFELRAGFYWSRQETIRSTDREPAAWHFDFSAGRPYEGAKQAGFHDIRALPVSGDELRSLPKGVRYDPLLIHKRLFIRE